MFLCRGRDATTQKRSRLPCYCILFCNKLTNKKNFTNYTCNQDQLNFPVFTEDWLASDELLLLEGIEMYGIGNWEDIAEHVATKTNKQCEEHYFTTYIDVPSCPKPNMNVKFTQDQILAATQQKNTALSKPVRRAKPMPSHPVNHELSGFMPKRGEFEIEYDNDIEYVLTDMCFNEDDTPTERELKLSVLHIYNQRVKYREEVRKFVIDHNILDLKKHQMNDRERTPDQKKIYHKSKKLLQIISEEEHQEFINDLILEKELRNKLATLCNYRKNGIRTMSDAKLFDSDRKETRSRKDARSRLRDKDIETDTSFDLLSTAEREVKKFFLKLFNSIFIFLLIFFAILGNSCANLFLFLPASTC